MQHCLAVAIIHNIYINRFVLCVGFVVFSLLCWSLVSFSVSDFAMAFGQNLFGHKTWKRIPGAKTRLKFAGFRVGSETPNNFNSLDHKNRTNSKSNSIKRQASMQTYKSGAQTMAAAVVATLVR